MVMMVWLFVLMVITSSYTANLTSILTVQQLSSPITGIESLIASGWPIGYQVGSFSRSFLIDSLKIPQSRLVSLGTPEEYKSALHRGPSNGGVAAIIDELPYVELFLSKQTGFGTVGQKISKNEWGFVSKNHLHEKNILTCMDTEIQCFQVYLCMSIHTWRHIRYDT